MLHTAVPAENIKVITNTGTSVTSLMLRTGVVSGKLTILSSVLALRY
jgi:hypothetical protein